MTCFTGESQDMIDMKSLPGSVTQGTLEPRKAVGHQALVHGAYVRASSMHKTGTAHSHCLQLSLHYCHKQPQSRA